MGKQKMIYCFSLKQWTSNQRSHKIKSNRMKILYLWMIKQNRQIYQNLIKKSKKVVRTIKNTGVKLLYPQQWVISLISLN